jgi:hypothetical protein
MDKSEGRAKADNEVDNEVISGAGSAGDPTGSGSGLRGPKGIAEKQGWMVTKAAQHCGEHGFTLPCPNCRGPKSVVENDPAEVVGLRAATFLIWLETETDFGGWDESVKADVNKELMACLGLRGR